MKRLRIGPLSSPENTLQSYEKIANSVKNLKQIFKKSIFSGPEILVFKKRLRGKCDKCIRILREDSDFAYVTLACEDGKQFEAHKVILPKYTEKEKACSSTDLHEGREI